MKKTISLFVDSLLRIKPEYMTYCTDFYNPREIEYIVQILNRYPEYIYTLVGGNLNPENQAVYFHPEYVDINKIEEYIDILFFQMPKREINHRDILGALLNQGIKRQKIGDIFLNNHQWYIVLKKSVSDYVFYNMDKIGNQNIQLERKKYDASTLVIRELEYDEILIHCASMRLDAVVSEILNCSRQESLQYIKQGFVKVNYEVEKEAAKSIQIGDLLSIRKWGRGRLDEQVGVSKKGRIYIRILKSV